MQLYAAVVVTFCVVTVLVDDVVVVDEDANAMARQIRYAAAVVVCVVIVVHVDDVVVFVDEDANAMARQIRYAFEGDTQLAGDEA